MNAEKHKKADDLESSIKKAIDRVKCVETQKGELKGTSVIRAGKFSINGYGRVTLPRELTKMILIQVEAVLNDELKQLEKEYSDL